MEPRDSIRFVHQSARGFWMEADLTAATLRWRRDDGTPRPLSAADVATLRALAEAVRAEDAMLQPTHITYAQREVLEVVLAGVRTEIDIPDGEISVGPPAALVEAMGAMVRALASP